MAEAFSSKLVTAGVVISMDGRGRFMDNIFIERLWRSIKYEEVHLKGAIRRRRSWETATDIYDNVLCHSVHKDS